MPAKKSTDRFKGTWELTAPGGKRYEGHLKWKRFYAGENAEKFALFKILPRKKSTQ